MLFVKIIFNKKKNKFLPPQSSFDYTELCSGGAGSGGNVVLENGGGAVIHHQPIQMQIQQQQQQHGTAGSVVGQTVQRTNSGGLVASGATTPNSNQPRSRPWHDFGRQNDADKIQIPKL